MFLKGYKKRHSQVLALQGIPYGLVQIDEPVVLKFLTNNCTDFLSGTVSFQPNMK